MKYILTALLLILFSCDDEQSVSPLGEGYCHADYMPEGTDGTYLRFTGIQPNPDGDDDKEEKFYLKNFSEGELDYHDYEIQESGGVKWQLGELTNFGMKMSGCKEFGFTSQKDELLSNEGEKVYLLKNGDTIQTIEYGPAGEGEIIWFNQETKNSSDE